MQTYEKNKEIFLGRQIKLMWIGVSLQIIPE